MNSHTRYEIPVDHTAPWIVLGAMLLALLSVLGVAYLIRTTPGELIPTRQVQMPKAPSRAYIQQTVDQPNPVLQATEKARR